MKLVSYAEAKALRLTKYFTGKPCKYGHIAERNAANRACLECQRLIAIRIYNRKKTDPTFVAANRSRVLRWQTENPERYHERQTKWREDNLVLKRSLDRNYRVANRENISARRKQQRKDDPTLGKRLYERRKANDPHFIENQAISNKSWRRRNPDRIAATMKKWKEQNLEKYLLAQAAGRLNRRTRKKENGGHATAAQLRDLYNKQNGKCANCGIKFHKMEFDHIQPLSRGGSGDISNIQLLCRNCNRTKAAKDPITWAQNNGRLL